MKNWKFTKKWQETLKEFKKSYRVKVGYPSESTGKEQHEDDGINNATLAAVHNLGSVANNIPPRPFLKQSFEKYQSERKKLAERLVRDFMRGAIDMKTAHEKMGNASAGWGRKIFTTGDFAPLKPATVARKGSSRPLIDTGELRRALTFEVVKK